MLERAGHREGGWVRVILLASISWTLLMSKYLRVLTHHMFFFSFVCIRSCFFSSLFLCISGSRGRTVLLCSSAVWVASLYHWYRSFVFCFFFS
jgi:hypothetical protein